MGSFRKPNRFEAGNKSEGSSYTQKFVRDRPERRFEGGNGGRSRGGFGNSEYGRPKPKLDMVEVTCDKCGKECKVPFKPTRGKPVYCSDCFRKQGGGDRVGSDRRGSDRPSSSGSVDLSEINYKLDQIMQALKIR